MEGAVGVMLIPVITAAVTDKLAEGEMTPFRAAVTVVVPTETPVATPLLLLIVATPVLAEAQVA